MLGGKISNQDEEEVEDELEALEAEILGAKSKTTISDAPLPNVPDTEPERERTEVGQQPARVPQEERQAMYA